MCLATAVRSLLAVECNAGAADDAITAYIIEIVRSADMDDAWKVCSCSGSACVHRSPCEAEPNMWLPSAAATTERTHGCSVMGVLFARK